MASEAGPSTATELDSASYGRLPDRPGDDADTCRICRGEGTADEPLFFPCKCSGSIKYVHQECLMEWLSHSQKKYCELCKTSFRFTKLYHPGMPSHIPTSVFVRRAAIHVLKMLVTWLRAVLVASVWLILLPYCMRVVWRSLFWVGDGGWSRELYAESGGNNVRTSSSQPWDLDTMHSAIESVKATNTSVPIQLPNLLMPFSQTLNMSTGEPTIWTLVKHFFFGFSYPLVQVPASQEANSTSLNATANTLGTRNPSLLSNVACLNWFRSPAANRFLIDVLEGQFITLVVVVCFILIFLIREWVVQQQPVINMVALGEDRGADRVHVPAMQDVEEDAEQDVEEDRADREEGEGDYDRVYDNAADATVEGANEGEEGEPSIRQRALGELRRRRAVLTLLQESGEVPEDLRHAIREGSPEDVARVMQGLPLEESAKLRDHITKLTERTDEELADALNRDYDMSQNREEAEDHQVTASSHPTFPQRTSSLLHEGGPHPDPPDPPQRPNMPARDRSFIATEIRRNMEEGETWSFANAPHADEERPLQPSVKNVPESWEEEVPEDGPSHTSNDGTLSDQEPDSERSSESWQQIPDIVIDDTEAADISGSSKGKGKTKVTDEDPHTLQSAESTPVPEDKMTDESMHANDAQSGSGEPSTSLDQPDNSNETEEQEARADQGPEPMQQAVRPPHLMDRILDWLFGDVAPGVQVPDDPGNDEHVVRDLADEAPFVPFAANEPRDAPNPPIQDPEVAAAAAQAGIDLNDQDAIDDAEDLEGIMELIGMQGPLTGLFQNAMFSAVLISATLACAVWFPYLWGKVVLLFMGSPISLFIKLPLQFIAILADIIVDTALGIVAGVVFWQAQFIRLIIKVFTMGKLSGVVDGPIDVIARPARSIAEGAMDRIGRLVLESSLFPHPDYFRLSINSHAALRSIQNSTSYLFNETGNAIVALYGHATAEPPAQTALWTLCQIPIVLQQLLTSFLGKMSALASWIWNSKSYKITLDLDFGRSASSTYSAMEQWTIVDRIIAVLAGYTFFAIVGALYLKRGTPISSSQQGRKIEGIIADILQQAGGVLKVILIISIEMLAFPLYCGLLLDIALLPLFRNASLYTRWQFTRENPWTSGFVHWFIGTCYMFHFALFVSMCRKIMRKGVLYFIRDPDDPTFHPVRDVLERSVTTQLRKIAFSALVYGGLVIICLGGVVWGLDRATTGVLPIHWTSHAPSLEFPLDLLFYNFLTPFIIKFYKPSDGLHAIYQWWFKACARLLRLSNFLFGEKVKAEEGHHVRRTWSSWFAREKGDPEHPVIGEDRRILVEDRGTRVYFFFDGKYVRAPASDQVRIPKGEKVFVEVDRFNHRKDGKTEGGVHNDLDMVTMVYIPPWFRVRIAIFVLTIWIFAATTGVGITILPLLFGRYLFSLFLPPTVEMNDIHAFSLGLYTLGTLTYSIYHLYKFVSTLNRPVPSPLSTLLTVAATATRFGLRVLRFSYVWTSLVFVIPFMFAMILELYFLMPLHAYLGPSEPHVVHVIQDWTLGFLYARLAARIIFADRTSRAARAFNAIITDGYLNPNARLTTRCFLLPVVVVFAIAVAAPSALAWALNRTIWLGASAATKSQVWRFSFPLLGVSLLAVWIGRESVSMLNKWRMVVRDEVYLIGERLHNFGEKKPPPTTSNNSVKIY